jgi:hypothetical protein
MHLWEYPKEATIMRSGAIDGRSTGAADNFDKTRKISVLY